MKQIIKLKITHEINGVKTLVKDKKLCGYCESGNIYLKKKEDVFFCRNCGEESSTIAKGRKN